MLQYCILPETLRFCSCCFKDLQNNIQMCVEKVRMLVKGLAFVIENTHGVLSMVGGINMHTARGTTTSHKQECADIQRDCISNSNTNAQNGARTMNVPSCFRCVLCIEGNFKSAVVMMNDVLLSLGICQK